MSPNIGDVDFPELTGCKEISDLYDWYEPTNQALQTEKGAIAEKLRLALEKFANFDDTYRVSVERMLVDPDYKDAICALLLRNKFNLKIVVLFEEDKVKAEQENASIDMLKAEDVYYLMQDFDVDAVEGIRLVYSLLQFIDDDNELEDEIRVIIGHLQHIHDGQEQKKLAIERFLVTELTNALFRLIENGATAEIAKNDLSKYMKMIESFSAENRQILKETAGKLLEELAD